MASQLSAIPRAPWHDDALRYVKLKRNILAGYAAQAYVALVGIALLPLCLKYMGAEAYGLVGFFVLLQSLFQLLDMGITPTLTREAARVNGEAAHAWHLRRLLRLMEFIFISTSLLACLVLVMFSDVVAGDWLQVRELDLLDVRRAIELMAVIAALRLVGGLYRGVISGFERLVWLNGLNVLMATARFVFVVPFFIYVGSTPTLFFIYQLFLASIELIALVVLAYRWLPDVAPQHVSPGARASLKAILKFSLSIAVTSTAWLFVTNLDKLVLSKFLSLSDYAYFTLAVLAASGVTLVTVPVSTALLPRLSALAAAGDDRGLLRVYGSATQLVAIVALPMALMAALFPQQILWAWTGDAEVVKSGAEVLRLYALGNGVLAMSAFPFYLQFAKGDLRMHLVGSGLFCVVLVPVLVCSTITSGALGAGWAWLGVNLAYFVFWVPLVHKRFFPRLHWDWLRCDIGGIFLPAFAGGALAHWLITWPQERLTVSFSLLIVGAFMSMASMVGSSWGREMLRQHWPRW